MAQIAAGAEVSKGTPHLYFKSKEELYFSLIEPILEEHHRRIADIIADDTAPADRTLKAFFSYFADTYPHQTEMRQVYMYFRDAEIRPLFSEARYAQLKKRMAHGVEMVETVVTRGIRQGVFKPVNTRAVSGIIWSLVIGILKWEENRRFGGGSDRLRETIDAAVGLFLEGLQTHGSASS